MPRTVEEGFDDFLTKLKAKAPETEAAKRHRASIEACLVHNFGLTRFVRIGSFGNGTSVSGYSDIDYLASIPAGQLTQSSAYSLTKIRDALDRRFPRTGVHVNTCCCRAFRDIQVRIDRSGPSRLRRRNKGVWGLRNR